MHLHPVANGKLDLIQFTYEEVIRIVNPHQLCRLFCGVNNIFDPQLWSVLIARAADKELRLRTRRQETVVIVAILGLDGQSQSDQSFDALVAAAGLQAHGGAKGESGKQNGKVILTFQPVESRLNITSFFVSIMRAFA